MNTLIHVGVELVIIGGVTFYLHKKISSVQEENEELKRVIVEHEERIKRCEEFIQGMANMMNGGPPLSRNPQYQNPQHQNLQPQNLPPQTQRGQGRTSVGPSPQTQHSRPPPGGGRGKPQLKPQPKPQSKPAQQNTAPQRQLRPLPEDDSEGPQDSEPELGVEEIDKVLNDELQIPIGDNEECNGEVCYVNTKKKNQKQKKLRNGN
jgi:hypothetical protein